MMNADNTKEILKSAKAGAPGVPRPDGNVGPRDAVLTLRGWAIPAFILLCCAARTLGQTGGGYNLTWHTIDGGGVMFSTSADGQYELSGTIGQADASNPLSGPPGSGYELTGGFWFALAPGDHNGDGGVNLLDYHTFKACMTGPGVGVAFDCASFDENDNGTIDLLDFASFQASFSGG